MPAPRLGPASARSSRPRPGHVWAGQPRAAFVRRCLCLLALGGRTGAAGTCCGPGRRQEAERSDLPHQHEPGAGPRLRGGGAAGARPAQPAGAAPGPRPRAAPAGLRSAPALRGRCPTPGCCPTGRRGACCQPAPARPPRPQEEPEPSGAAAPGASDCSAASQVRAGGGKAGLEPGLGPPPAPSSPLGDPLQGLGAGSGLAPRRAGGIPGSGPAAASPAPPGPRRARRA